jgi:hypothetical protein
MISFCCLTNIHLEPLVIVVNIAICKYAFFNLNIGRKIMLQVGSSLKTLDASMRVVFTWAETDPQYLAFKKKNKIKI